MSAIWEETVNVRAIDADLNNKLKVSSIFNYMQNSAAAHADSMHFGFKDLYKKGLLWVLSWVKIEFEDYPKFEDSIKVETWPKGHYKLYALRDFLLKDSGDNIFSRATTAWLLINAETKRITDLSALPGDIPYQTELHALKELPSKIVAGGKESVLTERIRYSDIDVNRHVNNAKYIESILDCYPEDHHMTNKIKSIKISFLSETKFGDELEFRIDKNAGENGAHIIEGINKATGKPVVISIIDWQSI